MARFFSFMLDYSHMENTTPTPQPTPAAPQSAGRPWPLTVFGILGITISVLASAGLIWLFSVNEIVFTPALLAPFSGVFVALALRLAAGIGMLMMRKWVFPVFIVTAVLSGLSVVSAAMGGLGIGFALTAFLVELAILWYLWRVKQQGLLK